MSDSLASGGTGGRKKERRSKGCHRWVSETFYKRTLVWYHTVYSQSRPMIDIFRVNTGDIASALSDGAAIPS